MNAFIEKLLAAQDEAGSLVCVGLDTDLERIPQHLQGAADPVLEFNKAIIEATRDICCA